MQNLKQNLRFLGLTKEEIKIYLTCLQYGTVNTTQISKLTKIGRVNCYHHTDKLVKKGLISVSQKEKIKHFSAENPKVFINREIEKLNLAREIVPELLAMSSENPRKPRIQFFEGKAGIKNVLAQMTEIRNSEIVSFSNFKRLAEFLPEFLPEHFEKRFTQNIKTRFISPRTRESNLFKDRFFPKNYDPKLLEIFLISPEEFHFESEISIFAGSIAILNLNEKNPIGVLIENPELYNTQKDIFDLAWLGATSFITN